MGSRRTVLITGGTGSLGFAAAREVLAHDGWDVVITGRADVAGAAARLGAGATGHHLDLGSLAAVRRFARDLPPLDAVVCNAGLMAVSGPATTADGVEATFGVNHLAHFLLVREVLPSMRAAGRVVFVSSATHDPAQRTGFPPPRFATARELAHPDDADGAAAESPMRAGRRRYAASKLCNVLTAYEFARRVPATTATFTAFDPGQMPGTGLARDHRGVMAFAWHRVMPALTLVPGINRHTPRWSGAALARLVVDPALAGVTGRYVNGRREVRSSAQSYDPARAADLWETSLALTAAPAGSGGRVDRAG
jgi:NAD(P)-dependent dehydrogenase (short-subunit alcohol dehydrogenase family)